MVQTRKLIVQGKNIYNSDIDFIKDRRKFSFEGLILVSLIINSDYSLHKEIKITQIGLAIDKNTDIELYFKDVFLAEFLKLSQDKKSSDIIISDLIKETIRKYI